MNYVLIGLGSLLLVLAIGCYSMRAAAHMSPIGDMFLVASFASLAAFVVRTATDKMIVRQLCYGLIWIFIAGCPFLASALRRDDSWMMVMATMYALVPAAYFLVRGAIALLHT
jgi:hypothetical protein